MASAIRDFSYILVYSRKLEDFSTFSRIMLPFSILISLVYMRLIFSDVYYDILGLTTLLFIELSVISYFRGFRNTLNALRLMAFFVLLGTLIYSLSHFIGWVAPEPVDVIDGALSLVVMFLAFSLLFQLVSLKEWRRILSILGFKQYSVLFSLIISQIPIVIFYASEAFTTIRLKYGSRKIHKVIVPLVLLSLQSARSLMESYTIYGVSHEHKLITYRANDVVLYVASVISMITPLLINSLA
ncbi:MAG: hypothetical protein QXS24_02815 [Desulfurococcaceae archaeon]